MVTTIFSGLSVGALYALVACLLTISLVRCGVFNFAQANFVVLGGYIAADLMLKLHWPVFVVILALAAFGAGLGAVQEITTIRPLHGRGLGPLITTVAGAIIIQGVIIAIWGTDPRSLPFFGGEGSVTILGGRVQPVDLWLIFFALLAGGVFSYAVGRTRWGLLGRAAHADQVAATLRGVDIPRLRTVAFALAGALSCALAPFAAAKTGVTLDSGLHLVIFGFAAGALGGFGSFAGATVGGFLIGLVEAFAARYLGVDWVNIIIFALLATIFLAWPTGLLGRRNLRAV